MATSPTSCGISWAATAIAVLIAERHRGQHGRADDRAVDEVVKGVADDHQRRRRTVHLALVGVAVAQQHQLFEHEEDQDAGEQRARTPAAGASIVNASGSSAEQRDAEQRADGVADQPGTSRVRTLSLKRSSDEATSRPPQLPRRLSPSAVASRGTRHSKRVA